MWIYFLFTLFYAAEASDELGRILRRNIQDESYFSAEGDRSVLKQKKKCYKMIQKISDDIDQDFQLATCLKDSVFRIAFKYTNCADRLEVQS